MNKPKIVLALYAMIAVMVAAVLYGSFTAGGHSHGAAHVMKAQVNSSLSDAKNLASLQRGSAAFRDYCFSCHGLSAVRYNQLQKIGLTEDHIKDYMITGGGLKPGDMMQVGMNSKDARNWFGAAPPDLSLITSSKGEDYIYSYLNGFYKDEARPTGWNNLYFNNVGMPHVLWEEQGTMKAKIEQKPDHSDPKKMVDEIVGLERVNNGKKNDAEYQQMTQDITNFLYWAAEPDRGSRHVLGYFVMGFLALLALLAYLLNKNYWKDIK